MLTHLGLKGLIGTIAAVAAVAGGSFAFTASSSVQAAQAAEASGAISGSAVSSVAYSLNAAAPSNIDAVTFSIGSSPARTVKAQLAEGGAWYPCTATSGSVSCATTSPQLTVTTATTLHVVATG